MNIAFIVTHLSHGSPGSFERVHEIVRNLADLSIKSTIFTPFNEDKKNITDVNIEVLPSTLSRLGLSSFAYKAARKAQQSTLTSNFFLSETSVSGMVANIRSGIRKIMRRNKFDILHAIQPIAALACAPIAKELGIPLMADLHNIWPEEAVEQKVSTNKDNTFIRLWNYEQNIIDSSDVVTVVSDFMKSYIVRNYSVSNKSIVVLPPGGPLLDNLSGAHRENNVVYSGMVSHREHVDLLARSIPLVKQAGSFFISSYGDAIDDIQKINALLGPPRLNYFWFVKRYEAFEFLKRSKIGILTSQNNITRQLGTPCKLFSYMACGLPIIANDIGGWSDMIKDENIGLLTNDDPEDFADSIDMLLADDSLWHRMHSNAINLIRTKYNWKKNVQDILIPIYDRLGYKR